MTSDFSRTRARCPKDPNHKRFVTVVHMTEDWVVDENGDFLEVANSDGEVVHGPDPGHTWTCQECGADADVTPA